MHISRQSAVQLRLKTGCCDFMWDCGAAFGGRMRGKMTAGQIGIIIILVLALAVLGGGYVAYRKVSRKMRDFSRTAFGTDSIVEGFKSIEREAEITPKSVSTATNLYLPQILRDFPEFHYEEMKNRAENVLTGFLQGIDTQSMINLTEGTTSELREKLRMKIDALKSENAEEHFRNILIHRTEIKSYRKIKGRCSILFQSAVQYNHYKECNGKIVEGAEDRLEQSRYNVEMIYIQDRDMVENQSDSGLAMNCPNCGAPLPKLGAKKCLYCDTPIVEFSIRIWNFSDVDEA